MFTYVVYIQINDYVVSKHVFPDYDRAVEFAEFWAINGLTYTIVEI